MILPEFIQFNTSDTQYILELANHPYTLAKIVKISNQDSAKDYYAKQLVNEKYPVAKLEGLNIFVIYAGFLPGQMGGTRCVTNQDQETINRMAIFLQEVITGDRWLCKRYKTKN